MYFVRYKLNNKDKYNHKLFKNQKIKIFFIIETHKSFPTATIGYSQQDYN